MRIGIVSDTHSLLADASDMPQQVVDVFRGTDLIIHCGDLDTLGVLDRLEEVAPVRAVRGYPDPVEDSERLSGITRVVEAEGLSIGVIHDIAWPGIRVRLESFFEFPDRPFEDVMISKFGKPVQVIAFGDTHEEMVAYYQGVLMVNPGSPTKPGLRHGPGELGTVAIMEIRRGVVTVELVKLKGFL